MNLPHVDWRGVAEGTSVIQTFINRLVWENGFTQVVDKPIRADSLLDVYFFDLKMHLHYVAQFKGSVTIAECC